jgi:hypothetical protein
MRRDNPADREESANVPRREEEPLLQRRSASPKRSGREEAPLSHTLFSAEFSYRKD